MRHFLQLFQIRSNSTGNRMELLDFLRGLTILLVLVHHAMVPYGDWILVFHMPLLFVLSGYTEFYQKKSRKFGDYLKNRIFRLVIPYFLFELVNLAAWAASVYSQGSWQDLSDAAYAIVYCLNTKAYTGYYGRLWFLPCMFVSSLLFFGIKKFCAEKKPVLWFSAVILLALSWCSCHLLNTRLPFAMDTALMASAFLVMGYVLGSRMDVLMKRNAPVSDLLLLAASLVLMRISVIYGKGYCLMFINNYGPFIWSVLAAASGCAAFLVIAKWMYAVVKKIPAGKHLVLWYGYHSLAVFPVHLSIKMAFLRNASGIFVNWYVLLPAMVFLTIPIVNGITQYFPFMLGKFPSFRKEQGKI